MFRAKALFALSVSTLMAFLMASIALAAISGTTGDASEIAAPPSVKQGNLESDNTIQVFSEATQVTLPHDLFAGVTEPGDYNVLWRLSPGRISAGTVVDSFMLHTDPFGRPYSPVEYDGSVTFDEDVLGIMVTVLGISTTDNLLGSGVTDYPTFAFNRGMEMFGRQDTISLSADKRTVTVHFETSRAIDQIRVITSAGASGEPTEVEINTQVGASADDAYDNTDGAFPGFSSTDFRVYAGNVNGRPITGGFRWTGLNIPANATITEAYVELNQREFGFEFETTLTLENSAAPAEFSSASSPVDRKANTTTFSQVWAWPKETPGSWIQTPSLVAGIQELVNNHGEIDSIVLLEDGTGVTQNHFHEWQSFDSSPALAAKLHIVYQTP